MLAIIIIFTAGGPMPLLVENVEYVCFKTKCVCVFVLLGLKWPGGVSLGWTTSSLHTWGGLLPTPTSVWVLVAME